MASLENLFQTHAEWPSGGNVPDVLKHSWEAGGWSEQRRRKRERSGPYLPHGIINKIKNESTLVMEILIDNYQQ